MIESERKKLFKKIGSICSLIGEVIISIQGLIFFALMGEITSETITWTVLIPIPAFILIELLILIAIKKKIPFLGGFGFFLLLTLGSLALYFGGGWYFGTIYTVIGGVLRIAAE